MKISANSHGPKLSGPKQSGSKLSGRLVKVADVGLSDLEAMFAIFNRYYLNVTWDGFLRDFREKSHVILLRERTTKQIRGFTTLKMFEAMVDGREVAGLFSGDTVIERDFWGQSALRSAFCRLLIVTWWRNLVATAGRRPCYWFLISKGYKTYLLLTNNFPTHWPRHDRTTPAFEREVMRRFAENLYPGRLQARTLEGFGEKAGEACVLPFSNGAPCLREGVAPIRDELFANPNIHFFERANPGWREGHELCCLAPIGPQIFLRFVCKSSFAVVKHAVRAAARQVAQVARRGLKPAPVDGAMQ